MSEKKVGKRLLTWVLVLVMTLSLLPLNVLAANPAVMRIVRPDTDKYITYNFYLNEGDKTPYYSQIIENNESLDVPATPEKEGYKFDGWYNGDEQFTTFGTPISVTADSTDVNLYAKFDPVCYVYFMDGEGEGARIIATKEVTATDPLNDFSDVAFPIGADEAITGWKDASGNHITSVSFNDGTTYLYPIVEKGHWIEFNSNGGSYVEPQFVTDTTKEPTAPTKPGYDFAGWYDGNTKFTFDGALDSNKSLTAHWTAKNAVNYTVIHRLENADDDGYSYKESEILTGTAGELTEDAVDKSYEGFTLDKVEQKEIAGDGSTIINVYYKRNVYTVTFVSDERGNDIICGKEAHRHIYSDRTWSLFGGTKYKGGCYPSERYSRNPVCGKEEHSHNQDCYGKLLKELTITDKYGANISDKWPTYNGSNTWKTSKNGNTYQVNIDTMPLGGATFYGPKTGYGSETAYYYVEVLPGESGTNHNGTTYKLHHSDTSPGTGYSVSEEDKYSITGFTYKEGTPNGYAYDNAKFYYTRDSYNIIFINGGNTENTKSKKYQQDISTVSYTPTAPAGKVGYEFAGWYDNELCEGDSYIFTSKTMPAQNITVYAKWEAPTFTVTVYNVDKTTTLKTFENVPLRGTISKDAMPTNKVTLADGDTFLGWTYEDGTPFNFNTAITKNIDLYARVGNKTGYSVTYVTAEGSSPVTDDKLYAEDAYATVRNGPSAAPKGEVFLYWTNNGKKYYPNDKVLVPKGGVTLTAVYGPVAQVLTLTYHANYPEGLTAPNPAIKTRTGLKNNERIPVAADNTFPDPAGYAFDGWNTEADGTGTKFPAGSSARVDNIDSNDLYAQWKLKTIETEVVVKITGETSTKTYNGSEQSITGYTTDVGDKAISVTLKNTGKDTAKGTNVGKYYMSLTKEDFAVTSDIYKNIKVEVTDGWLKIEPRNVILTSASDEKVYDGTPLTKSDVTVGGNGFVEGEVSNITATGSVTNVSEGEVANTIVYTTGAKFNANNYNIQKTEGKLKITPITNEVTVTITGNHDTKVYNASEQSVSGYTTDVNGKTISVALKEGSKAEAKGINVGKYDMHLTAADFTVSSTNYSNINVVVNDGYLEITPVTDEVTVTITGNTKTVMYNGSEQSVSGYTTDVDGKTISVALKDGSKAEAKGINVGKYDMHLTAADFTVSSTNYSNIKVVVNDGYLEITPITETATVTITGNHNSVKYNGREQSVTGFTYTAPEGVTVALRDSFKAEAKGTNVGTYKMDLTSEYFTVTSNIYKEFKIVVNDGYLEITRSGGHHPRPKPTVEIEDDDALGLNTTDHFAYIVGYGNGEVRPQNNITRAEVATIFFRLLTDDVRDENLTKTNRYSDVAATSWYNTAVSTLSSMGIITGYPDGTFRPNAAITRAEFAAIAARFDNDGDKTAAKFSDIATHWAKDEISIAYNNGWINGYPNGTFGPQRDITRAETMTLVNRVLNRLPETEDDLLPNMVTWTDNANPNAWYYLAVQEATNSHYYEFKTNSQYEKWTELRETRDWSQLEK